jgi:hypothetical protein
MSYAIKQSSTQSALMFLMIQSSDHITGLTGASPTVLLSKNGASFASPSGSVSEVGNGWYKVAGNATDSNTLGPLALHATAASADPSDVLVAEIVAYDPQDAVHLGLTCLPNTAVTTNGSLITSGSGTDQLTVASGLASSDAKKINAVSTSSVTTVGANVGTTQPINFTGTSTTAYVKTDVIDIAGTASAGTAGYVGIDWGHINAPTTSVALTGTTISTSQVVASVTGAVGSVTGSVGSVTAGVTVTTNNDKTGYSLSSAGIGAIYTTQLTEAYAALGVVPTAAQILFEIRGLQAEKAVASTTLTTHKIDGSTTAATYTLSDAVNPVSITRAT